MADKYDDMIDAVAGGRDKYDDMIDAAEPMRDSVSSFGTPPPNDNFEIAGRSQPAMGSPTFAPQYAEPGQGVNFERALLTNEPTQGFTEGVLRSAPAAIGGMIGATGGAGVASIPFAGLGAAGGEGLRQNAVQLYSAHRGVPLSSPGQVAGRMAIEGVANALGQGVGVGLTAGVRGVKTAIPAITERLPSTLKQFFGTPEPITQYAMKRGSGSIFTPQNLDEGAALANVGQATTDLASARRSVGAAIGTAENSVLAKIGDKAPAIRHIRAGLEDALYARGITDPVTAGLARSRESSLLTKLVDVLTPVEGSATATASDGISRIPIGEKLTLRQAINAKRLIDDNLEFAGKEMGSATEQLLKRTNHQLRESVRSDMGDSVGKLWDQFGTIADAQEKLAEFTGTRALSNVEQRAVQSLRGIMLKNPGEVDAIVEVLGAGLPGGKAQARQIFDSIAADAFSKSGIGAPSSTLLKTLTAGGLLSGPSARGMVRGAEALNSFAASPTPAIGQKLIHRVVSSKVADHYLSQRRIPVPDPAFQAIGGVRPALP